VTSEPTSVRRFARALRAARCALAALFIMSCGRAGSPCAAPSCGAGYECLANTCAPAGAEPVPKDSIRVVLEPAMVATPRASDASQGSVNLGSEWAALYLRFDTGWKRNGAVVRAFLLLEPADSAETDARDVTLDVWTIGTPWSESRVAMGARPNLTQPRARGILRTSPASTARIDVTRLALALTDRPEDDGIAVVATSSKGRNVRIRTGPTGGAPRLELYVRGPR
jgi:hypothetical protein